jgi:hypothetical protein
VSLALASCQLIHTAITAGTSRVAYGPLCLRAVATTPAGPMETLFALTIPSSSAFPESEAVGPCVTLFEACSAFTHVTACMLTESPMRPYTEGFIYLRCFGCYRAERISSRAGFLSPAEDQRLSRRTPVDALIRH